MEVNIDQRPKTKDQRPKTGDQRFQRKMCRRRFLMVSAKALLGVMLAAFIPFNVNWADEGRKKFVMKIKPFKESDLYQEHNLAG